VLSTATAFLIVSGLIVGGLAAAPAFAEPDPPATTTSETPPPATTPEVPTPSSSEAPAPSEPAVPAAPDVKAAQPDLTVTATVEPGTYVIGQEIPINVTVTNKGAGVATNVLGDTSALAGSDISTQPGGWRKFTPFQPDVPYPAPGGTIEAGATEKFVLQATARKRDATDPQLRIYVRNPDELTPADNEFVLTVPVVPASVTGTLAGVVYGDANDNNASDPGEELQDIEITLYPNNGTTRSVSTDSHGRFDFGVMPAMQYSLSTRFGEAQGWIVEYVNSVIVDGTATSANLAIRAERPLSQVLSAKAEFGAKSYQPGDVATVTVTLTNRGPKALSGIKAGCDRYGSDAHLGGWSDQEHYGDLGYDGPGATLAAGETRAFPLHGDVLQGAQDQGIVYLACDFGDDERYLSGFPTADAHAKVPGKNADLGGDVYQDLNGNNTVDDGEAVPNLRLGLTEWETDQVVAKTTTDVNGIAQFIRLPRGWYSPVVYGPWKIVDPEKLTNPMRNVDHFSVKVVPGPDNPEPTDTPPADPVPPVDGGSGSGSSGGLASTGVEVLGPVAGGAAAVFAGILALFYARRLRRNEV